MKTQYYTPCSLDEFIATDDHSLEWLFQLGDIAETSYPDFIRDVGALAMGSATYEWMLRHFAAEGQDADANWPYKQPCWVFSSRELPAVGNVGQGLRNCGTTYHAPRIGEREISWSSCRFLRSSFDYP